MQVHWVAEAEDGTLHQEYAPGRERLKFADIDWHTASALHLISEQAEGSIQFDPVPQGLQRTVRRRNTSTGSGGKASAMLVVYSKVGAPINEATVDHVEYWLPNGSRHTCHKFGCNKVRDVMAGLAKGRTTGIHLATGCARVEVDAALTA